MPVMVLPLGAGRGVLLTALPLVAGAVLVAILMGYCGLTLDVMVCCILFWAGVCVYVPMTDDSPMIGQL